MNTPRKGWPQVEGIKLTAAICGVPESLVKAMKRKGSKAFLIGNRIDLGILVPEMFAALATKSALPEGIRSPQDWLATEKAKREEIRRKKDDESVVSTDEVSQFMARWSQCVFLAVKQILAEAPRELEESSKEKIKLWADEQFAALTKKLEEVKEI